MNTISRKPIKLLFIGVITVIALLAGSSLALSGSSKTTFPVEPAPLPDRECEQTIRKRTLKVEAGYARDINGNPLPGLHEEFPRTVPCPDNSAKNCSAWDYRFTWPNTNKKFILASVNVLSTRQIQAVSDNASIKGGLTFENSVVIFKPRPKGPVVLGTVITDEAQPALVTATGLAKWTLRRCAIQGPGSSAKETTRSSFASEQCVSFDFGGSMEVMRGADGCSVDLAEIEFFKSDDCGMENGDPSEPGTVTTEFGDFRCSGSFFGCEECVIETQNNQSIASFIINGKAIKKCFDFTDDGVKDCELPTGEACTTDVVCASGNCIIVPDEDENIEGTCGAVIP